ncbi:hypothetical protein, partial [Pseudomonas viridiflava]
LTGAVSQWISGHALPLLMAVGAAGFVLLLWRGNGLGEHAPSNAIGGK